MKIIKQDWKFIGYPIGESILARIESAGRTCYKSEENTGNLEQTKYFVQKLIKNGHHSVLEHVSLTVRIVTNRGVSHELVRHRLASYSQESTRYCDYGELTFIEPVWYDGAKPTKGEVAWIKSCQHAELGYLELRREGWGPEKARDVLPHALKTEIVMTANLREWRHVFQLRCAKRAHPQMRELMRNMLSGFQTAIPVVFDDITYGAD